MLAESQRKAKARASFAEARAMENSILDLQKEFGVTSIVFLPRGRNSE
jgi:hypothetical protein